MDPVDTSSAFNAAWAPGALGSPNLVDDASTLPHVDIPNPLGPPPALHPPPPSPSEDTSRLSLRAAAAAAAAAAEAPLGKSRILNISTGFAL